MVAYVFPGQGSQKKGMGEDLFNEYKELTDRASKILGYSIEELCVEDPDTNLVKTQYTQPALYVVNALNYRKRIDSDGIKPNYVAGHSLGEYNALFAAEVVDFETGLKLVQKRGELMSKAKDGGMAAVIGMEEEKIKDVLANNDLNNIDIANLNSPSQIVISGPKNDIINAQSLFESAGCMMYIPLNVSGAFHSRLMGDARKEFEEFLNQFSFGSIKIPIISNVLAIPYRENNIKQLLADQINHPVRWTDSICYMMGKGIKEFEEIGPGNVLTKMVQKIKREVTPQIINEITEKLDIQANEVETVLENDEKSDILKKEEEEIKQVQEDNIASISKQKIVFMYSGQGSHYYNMGRELYNENEIFRDTMDKCNSILEHELEKPLIDVIYDGSKKFENFDDILYTHPAIFSVGYSLTQVLCDRGIKPDSVLGYSVGEYVAAVVSGMLSLEDGLKIVFRQAKYLHEKCDQGGMLVVLDKITRFDEDQNLFQGTSIAAINYESCFVISGLRSRLEEIQSQLGNNSIASQLLPVN